MEELHAEPDQGHPSPPPRNDVSGPLFQIFQSSNGFTSSYIMYGVIICSHFCPLLQQ